MKLNNGPFYKIKPDTLICTIIKFQSMLHNVISYIVITSVELLGKQLTDKWLHEKSVLNIYLCMYQYSQS